MIAVISGVPNPMPESVKDRCTKSHEDYGSLIQNKVSTKASLMNGKINYTYEVTI